MSNCFEVTSKFGNICSFKSDSVNKGDKVYTTPQTKPLNNEEIDKVASIKMNQILMDLIDSEDWNKGCTKQHLVNFARAIEERHGIK